MLEKCNEDDTTIFEAVDALDQEKSALSWTDFMKGYCLRSNQKRCSFYNEQLVDRDGSLADVWKTHISRETFKGVNQCCFVITVIKNVISLLELILNWSGAAFDYPYYNQNHSDYE